MNDLWLMIKIIYYLLFVLALFLYARYRYRKSEASDGRISKFGLIALVLFTILFGAYGVICGPPGENTGDRYNYSLRFENSRFEESVKENSLGLYAIESVIHLFSNESSVLFFAVSAIYFCANIYCYKKLKCATPLYLLLFFLSSLGLFSFYGLKQALSLAFMNLALTKYFQDKKIYSIIFLIIAILCHEAAWVIVPCFVLARYCSGSNIKQALLYIGVLTIAIFFPQISKFFVDLFCFIPGLGSQIGSYVDETSSIVIDSNYFTIFKSMPYYIITILAIIYRSEFRERIKNYDLLLVLSVFCSIFSLLSIYMYWMFRFAMYCYVPCFILASQMAVCLKGQNRKVFNIVTVGIFLFLMIKVLIQYYFVYGGIV